MRPGWRPVKGWSIIIMTIGGGMTRAEQAADRIAVLARDTEPGSRLGTKNELRELCAVSVGTFNEALRLLQARGLVVVRPGPGGGLFVAETPPMVRLGNSVLALDADATTVADAVRIRDALDPLLAADAAFHSSPADVAGYREQLAQMAAATDALDAVAYMRANWKLHSLIAAVNPSPMLRELYTTLLDIVESHTLAVVEVDEQPIGEAMAERHRVHAELVAAIAAGDTAATAAAVAAHSMKSHRVAGG